MRGKDKSKLNNRTRFTALSNIPIIITNMFLFGDYGHVTQWIICLYVFVGQEQCPALNINTVLFQTEFKMSINLMLP